MSGEETALILAFLNSSSTDLVLLDEDVALNRRAAQNIVDHRNGPDGLLGSGDDELFSTLEELDAVPYVGPFALQQIRDFVLGPEAPTDALTIEGVNFLPSEAAAVVYGVNSSTLEFLDDDLRLNSKAAQALASSGPYQSITQIAEVYYVGNSALTILHGHAPIWRAELDAANALAGTYDSVTFDGPSAVIALQIANQASYDELTWNGVYFAGANKIIGNRPYTDLAQVAAVYGVGKGTMQGLLTFAQAKDWPSPACNGIFEDAQLSSVANYAANLETYDPYDRWAIAAFRAPECTDTSKAAHRAGLRSLLIEIAQWGYVLPEFADLLDYSQLSAGAGPFLAVLDSSLANMEYHRDNYIADGVASAQSDYDALVAQHALVRSLASANPESTFSLTIDLDALECSQDSALFIDLEAMLVIGMRRGPSC